MSWEPIHKQDWCVVFMNRTHVKYQTGQTKNRISSQVSPKSENSGPSGVEAKKDLSPKKNGYNRSSSHLMVHQPENVQDRKGDNIYESWDILNSTSALVCHNWQGGRLTTVEEKKIEAKILKLKNIKQFANVQTQNQL